MPALCMHFGVGLLHSLRLLHCYNENRLLALHSMGCNLDCVAGVPGGQAGGVLPLMSVFFTSTCQHTSNHPNLSLIYSYAYFPWLHGCQDLPGLPPEHPRSVSPFPTPIAGEAAWQEPGCEAGRPVGGCACQLVLRWRPEGGRGSEAAEEGPRPEDGHEGLLVESGSWGDGGQRSRMAESGLLLETAVTSRCSVASVGESHLGCVLFEMSVKHRGREV